MNFINVPEPFPIEEHAMSELVSRMISLHYTIPGCAKRLGVDPLMGVRFTKYLEVDPLTGVRFTQYISISDPVSLLVNLFIFAREVPLVDFGKLFTTKQLDDFQKMNLIYLEGTGVRSHCCLFPCYNNTYMATDHVEMNGAINQIMPIYGESYLFGGIINRYPVKKTLDLCTGSGIHAILAARHSKEVIGVDINSRAIAFSKFNAKLSGTSNVTFIHGDLYSQVNDQFDLILANPPYNPDIGTEAGANFWSGGETGWNILSRIIQGLPSKLMDEGVCNIVSLFPNDPGKETKDYVDLWLGEDKHKFKVIDATVDASHMKCPYVLAPPVKSFEAHRYGILVLKKSGSNSENWQIVDTSSIDVFNENGQPIYFLSFD
jgi:hypothetical protein